MTATTADDVRAWTAALDEIEAGLTRAHTALTDPVSERPPSWVVPSELGEIPAELIPRASSLLASVEAGTAEVATARAALLDELDGLADHASPSRRRAHADEPPAPRLVDHDA